MKIIFLKNFLKRKKIIKFYGHVLIRNNNKSKFLQKPTSYVVKMIYLNLRERSKIYYKSGVKYCRDLNPLNNIIFRRNLANVNNYIFTVFVKLLRFYYYYYNHHCYKN